jgi:UDP-N-acetylglucosamine 2-epimerase (non-hydrolysing)
MKVKPVLDALQTREVPAELVHTGQHYDPLMSDVFFKELGLRPPDHQLDVGSSSAAQQIAAIMVGFETLVERTRPHAVVVIGDVNSAIACALVAAKAGALVVHVEAGLRSGDWAMPEETNRVATDRLSDLLLAPSSDAVENLRAEGYRSDQIRLVGNVMIDSLLANLPRASAREVPARFGFSAGQYGVVTLHRPSNVDDRPSLERLLGALARVGNSLPLVFPVHPRTQQRLCDFDAPRGVQFVEPPGYLDFIGLSAGAAFVLTDSGGVQEETTALGVPCLTLRESTERPITVSEGTNRIVGTDPDLIVRAVRDVLEHPPAPRCPELWDGHAGERVADALLEVMNDVHWRRPTWRAP